MGWIYIATNTINGKCYIGQTIHPVKKRLNQHQQKSSKCRAFCSAIKKHGWKNFVTDWYECPDEDLNFDEELLVREMGTLSPNGYNLKEGGGSHGKMSEESKQKMREINIGQNNPMYGKTHSKDSNQKNKESHLGKTHSEESIQKMSGENHHMWGKKHSKESKQKISDGNKERTGEKNNRSKRVYQYDLDGVFIDSFGSTREAARHLKKGGTSIRDCARGERKTAYNFKWSYTFPFM